MTVLIRLSLFRAYVGTMKHNARLTAVTPQMNELMEVLKEAKKTNNNHEMTMAQRHLNELFKENNVHPLRGLKMIFFQIPVFVTMFSALRRMADAPIPGLHDGGFGWVTDLTLQDPYYILPITSMVLTNIVLRVCRPLPLAILLTISEGRSRWYGILEWNLFRTTYAKRRPSDHPHLHPFRRQMASGEQRPIVTR